MVTSADRYAKILDFGLAKLVEPQREAGSDPAGGSEAATAMQPQPLSKPGIIMGTAGYMLAEQARARREFDQRSDIFTFGCILYVATTRRQSFEGETVVDSLHKIIHAQPPSIRESCADAPPDLQRIPRRCLQKDREERYQTIKDVAVELRELRREMESAAEARFPISLHAAADPRAPKTAALPTDAGGGVGAPTAGSDARSTSSAGYPALEVEKAEGEGGRHSCAVSARAGRRRLRRLQVEGRAGRAGSLVPVGEVHAADDDG